MEKYFCNGKKDFCDNIENCGECQFADGSGVISSEKIDYIFSSVFGTNYDLSCLRELVEAENIIGKPLYFTKWFGPGVRIENPPIQRTVISYSRLRNGEILLHLKDGALPLRLIGDHAYKTLEAAEATLKGRKQDES